MRLAALRHVGTDRVFDVLLIIALACSGILLLFLGRHGTFLADEWTFIGERMSPALDVWLRPHNEHLSLLPVVAYELLFSLFGLSTYMPYLALLTVLHLVACAGVYRAVTMLSGRSAALAATLVLLLLGPASDDLFWAFQIGFVGSAAAGIWALVLIIPRTSHISHRATCCALLTVSLAASGIGLTFLSVALAYVTLEGRLRREWRILAVPIVLYLSWFLAYGRAALTSNQGQLSAKTLSVIPEFVVTGGGTALAAVTAAPQRPAEAAFLVVAFVLLYQFMRNANGRSLAVAAVIGIVAQFSLIGLVRAQFGPEQAAVSRYVYSAAVLVILVLGDLLGTINERVHGLRRLALPAIAACVVATNILSLVDGRNLIAGQAREVRAEIALVEADTAGELPGDRSLFPLPNVGALRLLIASAGSPLRDTLIAGDPAAATSDEADRAFFRVYGASLVTAPWDGTSQRGAVLELSQSHGVTLVFNSRGCAEATPFGDDTFVQVMVADGSAVGVIFGGQGAVDVTLARDAPPQSTNSVKLSSSPGKPLAIQLPHVGDGRPDILRVRIPPGGATLMCQLESKA